MENHKESGTYNKINQAYSSEPWWYDLRGFFILKLAYRASLWSQIKFFAENMNSEHLEVAVGSGSLLKLILWYRNLFRKRFCKITAIDYSERMLAGALKKLEHDKSIQFLLADAANMPFADNSFDSVNIANAIHCLPEIEKSFLELNRVLKNDGSLAGNVLLYPQQRNVIDTIATHINSWAIKKGILHRPYYKEEITELLITSGFEIIKLNLRGNSLDFLAVKKTKQS